MGPAASGCARSLATRPRTRRWRRTRPRSRARASPSPRVAHRVDDVDRVADVEQQRTHRDQRRRAPWPRPVAVMRRICTSSGSSMPIAAAATARSRSSRSPKARRRSPLSVRVLDDRAPPAAGAAAPAPPPAGPAPSTAASTARSSPASAAVDASSCATSAAWSCGSPVILGVVERHDPRLVRRRTITWSASRSPCATRAARQGGDVGPEASQERVGDRRRGRARQPRPRDRAQHEQRGTGPARPCDHDRRHVDLACAATSMRYASCSTCCTAGEREAAGADRLFTSDVPDLLAAAAWWASSRATTRMRSGPCSSSASTSVDAPVWSGAKRTLSALDPETRERVGDLGDGRARAGRAEQQVHEARHRPAEHDAREEVVRERGAEVERGRAEQSDELHPNACAGRGDVRRRGADDGHDDRDPHRRKRRGRALDEAGGDAQRAPEALVGDDELTEGACRPPREDTRNHEVAGQAQPAGDQCRHDHEADRPQRAQPVQGAEHRCQSVRAAC